MAVFINWFLIWLACVAGLESTMYFGVDQNGIANGLIMNNNACDRFRLDIDRIMRTSLKPGLLFTGYHVDFIQLYEDSEASSSNNGCDLVGQYMIGL